MLFGDRERLLKLYNAISGKNYQEPEALEINTLDNAIYIGIKNDLSFIIDEQLFVIFYNGAETQPAGRSCACQISMR